MAMFYESEQDKIIRIQVFALEAYKNKHKLSQSEIINTLEQYDLSQFIQNNYELLGEMGTNVTLDEIESYIKECQDKDC